jgi:hypothetical protein
MTCNIELHLNRPLLWRFFQICFYVFQTPNVTPWPVPARER